MPNGRRCCPCSTVHTRRTIQACAATPAHRAALGSRAVTTHRATIRQDSVWTAHCPAFNVTGSGLTRPQATRDLREKLADRLGVAVDAVRLEYADE